MFCNIFLLVEVIVFLKKRQYILYGDRTLEHPVVTNASVNAFIRWATGTRTAWNF